ncbi:LLM class F420-dependent oxidoreductase [Amycolatopsis sp. GM8]|uniref:LLM class F420-dependent oxidoreductase n=1 Tax=Amycolatopsis sp. GM8 TaxID=2896530 RepID=UPI001F1CF2BF|nr:LLM class F420-dependent oxidoreductase [Amycolatopsis sp. GM8]
MVEYPLRSAVENGAWLNPANIAEFARVAEEAGFDAVFLTDHPAPSRKWLDGGGHETLDPFVGLGFLAAATSTIRVMTYLTVVPFRNPILQAKSMTSVDVLSGGRAIFALGTGYLRSEFAALGVDMDERNELFDEAIEVMRGLWANPEEFHYEGRHFKAIGVTLAPKQVQDPHPPLWLGGNAKIVRDRVAAWGQGWAPLLGGVSTRTTRTRAIESDAELGVLIRQIKDAMAANGRDAESLDVACGGTRPVPLDASSDQFLDHYGSLREIGVTWTQVPLASMSFPETLQRLRSFGADVIAKSR